MYKGGHVRKIWPILFIFGLLCGCTGRDLADKTFSGTLEVTEHKLGAKAAGRLVGLMVDEGDLVTHDAVIATMDHYAQAKRDYERTEALFKAGGADLQAVEYARLAMEDQQIVSPIDGIVLVKVHEVGEMLSAGSPVVVIGDLKDRWVKVFVTE
jgi:multidrug efflux pump subunit AcrA (membrane-fusion protein)